MSILTQDLEYNRRLKEVLHIYNVSLKNNKGAETIRNFVKSVVEYFDYVIEIYLKEKKNKGEIEEIPDTPLKKYKKFLELINNKEIEELTKYYRNLRLCLNNEIIITNEFRRSMIIKCKGMNFEFSMDIKILKEIAENVKKFSEIITKYI
ncbi:MAG: hypothetical protein ACP5GJ_00250 [Nanopusillaceae archaeon]